MKQSKEIPVLDGRNGDLFDFVVNDKNKVLKK
jgi:hypothetical protein